MAFEVYILPDPEGPKMAIHILEAIAMEFIVEATFGQAEALASIEEHLSHGRDPVVLSANERSDLQTWMVAIENEPTKARKIMLVTDTVTVLTIGASKGVTIYNSRAKLKARLNWI
jgi:hypothetical protein